MKQMTLSEAKRILRKNGYELINEGKIGRALTTGALALGMLAGGAHADWTDDFINDVQKERSTIVFESPKQTVQKIENNKFKITTKVDGGVYVGYGTIKKITTKSPGYDKDAPYEINDGKDSYYHGKLTADSLEFQCDVKNGGYTGHCTQYYTNGEMSGQVKAGKADGKWIIILDSDDYENPTAVCYMKDNECIKMKDNKGNVYTDVPRKLFLKNDLNDFIEYIK